MGHSGRCARANPAAMPQACYGKCNYCQDERYQGDIDEGEDLAQQIDVFAQVVLDVPKLGAGLGQLPAKTFDGRALLWGKRHAIGLLAIRTATGLDLL